jgi:hypothetical protein
MESITTSYESVLAFVSEKVWCTTFVKQNCWICSRGVNHMAIGLLDIEFGSLVSQYNALQFIGLVSFDFVWFDSSLIGCLFLCLIFSLSIFLIDSISPSCAYSD